MTDREELRRVAGNATPGVWKTWGRGVMADQDGSGQVEHAVDVAGTYFLDENGKPRTWDADHICNFSPTKAMALLDELEAAEKRIKELEALVPKVEVVEKPKLEECLACGETAQRPGQATCHRCGSIMPSWRC